MYKTILSQWLFKTETYITQEHSSGLSVEKVVALFHKEENHSKSMQNQ